MSNSIALRTSSKRRDNTGFSLVELIIVIAIMAILTAILAPQLLKYVERARISRDEVTLDEVNSAINIALTDEATYTAVAGSAGSASTATVRYAVDGTLTASVAALGEELHAILGGQNGTGGVVSGLPALVSKTSIADGDYTFTINITANGVVNVTRSSGA